LLKNLYLQNLKISILITVFSFSVFAPIVNAQVSSSFPDVSTDSKYFTSIEYFKQKNVITGYTDGTFRPDQEANRAEALKIIMLGSNVPIVEVLPTDTDIFPDVKITDWFYPYIKKAKEMGIVKGYEDGTFKPEQTQNIAETLKMVLLTKGVTVDAVPANTSIYPDVSADVWFAPFALYSKDKHIITPQEDGKLNASRGITRGELIELMYRTEIVAQNNGMPFDISTNWPYDEYPMHAYKAKLPFGWKVINNEDEIVFWRRDTFHWQSSYEVPYPYSASVTFHLDHNGQLLAPEAYMDKIETIYKSDYGTYQKNTLMLAGVDAFNLNASPDNDDFYLFFPDNRVLQVYTSYGWSDLTEQLKLEIDGVLRSIQSVPYSENTVATDIIAEARNLILVEGQGQTALDKFDDEMNIETDTIGAGNGPVDYFYSTKYDITLKYERSTNTLLDIQTGKTSAF